MARSDAEEALVKLAESTNIPVVTSSGGKGTMPDSHPLSYGSCFSPRGDRQEMNQLYEVMQSADVVIGIGARFSLGNPAGESSTLVNINIDDAELTRVQSNTIPLHGDAKAYDRSPDSASHRGRGWRASITRGSRRRGPQPHSLLRHPAQGAPVRRPGGDTRRDSGGRLRGLGRHAVRLLRPHPLQGEPPKDLHRLRLLVQPRLRLPGPRWAQRWPGPTAPWSAWPETGGSCSTRPSSRPRSSTGST